MIPIHPQDEDTPIGSLVWTIREVASGTILGEGSATLRGRDPHVTESPNCAPGYYEKYIPLTHPFVLALREYPSPLEGRTGFGLRGQRLDEETFSWEWFLMGDSGRAVKIQESGELRFRQAESDRGWEVVETEFLTDADLRVFSKGPHRRIIKRNGSSIRRVVRFGYDIEAGPRWRITIRKGSSIWWPSSQGRLI